MIVVLCIHILANFSLVSTYNSNTEDMAVWTSNQSMFERSPKLLPDAEAHVVFTLLVTYNS